MTLNALTILDTCYEKRIHCEAGPWHSWGVCTCTLDSCTRKRIREVFRYNSCGGAACPELEETKICAAPFGEYSTKLNTPLIKIPQNFKRTRLSKGESIYRHHVLLIDLLLYY